METHAPPAVYLAKALRLVQRTKPRRFAFLFVGRSAVSWQSRVQALGSVACIDGRAVKAVYQVASAGWVERHSLSAWRKSR